MTTTCIYMQSKLSNWPFWALDFAPALIGLTEDRRRWQMLFSEINLGSLLLVLEPLAISAIMSPIPPRTPCSLLDRPDFPFIILILPTFFLKESHRFTCPYDSIRPPRQCAKLMGGSRPHSKAVSTMAITVKEMVPTRKSSLQSGCKTSRSSPHDDQTPVT